MISSPKWKYFDRNGKELQVGQMVTVQHCTGRYGQVRQVRGRLKAIGNGHEVYLDMDTKNSKEGNCIYPGFSPDRTLGENCMRGFHEHHDFEHGHVKWIEVEEAAATKQDSK